MRRWGTTWLAWLAAAALVAGCGGDDESGAPTTTTSTTTTAPPRDTGARCAQADLSAVPQPEAGPRGRLVVDRFQTKADGKLTIGANVDHEPFVFEEDGKETGFEVELVSEIAERMKLIPDVQGSGATGEALVQAMLNGTYDVAISGTVLPDAIPEADLSDPYLGRDEAFVVNTEKTPGLVPASLEPGTVVAVVADSPSATYATANCTGVEVRPFPTVDEALQALAAGGAAGVLADFAPTAYAVKTTYADELAVAGILRTGQHYRLPSASFTHELVGAFNRALADMREDGTYDELFEEWFGVAPPPTRQG